MGFSQEIQYMEPVSGGYTRFFYDINYHLVDKHCEFKSIERVAQFDTSKYHFDGEFKDFDKDGKLMLQGTYKNGQRDGIFTAFHPNGNIKWVTTYKNHKESDDWKYYYPDGKPLLELKFIDDEIKIVNYWDNLGTQKVTDGNGSYKMQFPVIGFSDHGYPSYTRSGNLLNGRPQGNWFINLINDTKKKNEIYLFKEVFENGELKFLNKNTEFENYFIPYEDFLLVPADYFARAEFFVFHPCNFDEFSGFKTFVFRKLDSFISGFKFNIPPTTFQFKVSYVVNNKGLANTPKIISAPENLTSRELTIFRNLFNSLDYFIPSIKDNKPISDNIFITCEFNILEDKTTIKSLKLEREKGQ